MFAPQAKGIFDNAAPFHTPDHMLDPHPNTGKTAVLGFGFWRQFPATWLFCGLHHAHSSHREALKAHILIQDAVGWKTVAFLVSKTFIMPFPFIRGTEKANPTICFNQDQIFECVLRLLATVVERLFVRISRAIYWSFGAVVEKRERATGSSSSLVAVSVAVRCGRWPAVASA